MTHRRAFFSTAAIAEKLYVCGGEAGRTHITVELFDPTHETWELLRPTLHHRLGARVAVLRDRLYLVGGRGDDGVALDSVECYRFESGTKIIPCSCDTYSWEASAPMSHARIGAKVARVNGALYVFGGKARNTQGGFLFFDIG